MIIAGYGRFKAMTPVQLDYLETERLKAGLQAIADLPPADAIVAIDIARRVLLGLPPRPDPVPEAK